MLARTKRWLSPSPSLESMAPNVAPPAGVVSKRTLLISALGMVIALISTFIAQLLTHLIGLVTNIAFFHRISFEFSSPSDAPNWGPWVIAVPAIGGVIVGLMARYGSKAIRGHGIPEAMENILINESRIPLRMTFLKPLSAAVAIGSGGPFGAEGPIIATGGALGSYIGQIVPTSSHERKTLLAAGAAAGMTAIFGSPISAVLLAMELLLFEFRPRSMIPVALAAATAAAARMPFTGTGPVFPMPQIAPLSPASLLFFILLGIVIGFAAVVVTKIVYAIEDGFEHLPIHWMWWPALGGIVVGLIGYFYPHTLGVGYENIDHILSGSLLPSALAMFVLMKFISWAVSLGSGTSGGTLAPLFTIGGGIGSLMGFAVAQMAPALGVSPGVAGLVGMAAIFAGASRALLASVVFAFETTQQPLGLMPLLAGCSVAYLISGYLMRNTIMTEKIARRGIIVPSEYKSDPLEHFAVSAFASVPARTVPAEAKASEIAARLEHTHQGFPVIDSKGQLRGVITRRDLATAKDASTVLELVRRQPVTVGLTASLREAATIMTEAEVGRLPVVGADGRVVGMLSRSDLLRALKVPKKAAAESNH